MPFGDARISNLSSNSSPAALAAAGYAGPRRARTPAPVASAPGDVFSETITPAPPPWMADLARTVAGDYSPAPVGISPQARTLAGQIDTAPPAPGKPNNSAGFFLEGGNAFNYTAADPIAPPPPDPLDLIVKDRRAAAGEDLTRQETLLSGAGQDIQALRQQVRTLREAKSAMDLTPRTQRELERMANPRDMFSPLNQAWRESQRINEKLMRGERLSRREYRRAKELPAILAASDEAARTLEAAGKTDAMLDATQRELRDRQDNLDIVARGVAANPLPTPDDVELVTRTIDAEKQAEKQAKDEARAAKAFRADRAKRESAAGRQWKQEVAARGSLAAQARRELARAEKQFETWRETDGRTARGADLAAKRAEIVGPAEKRAQQVEQAAQRDQEHMASGFKPPIPFTPEERDELAVLYQQNPHVPRWQLEQYYRQMNGLGESLSLEGVQ